jgi:hypothetical protein
MVNLAQTPMSKPCIQVQGASNAHEPLWEKNKTTRDNRHQTSADEIDVRRIGQGSGGSGGHAKN